MYGIRNSGCWSATCFKKPPGEPDAPTKFKTLLYCPLEKEVAIHSSILAWRNPWTEKLVRLQFMGSQRVGHDRVTNTYYPQSTIPVLWVQTGLLGFAFYHINFIIYFTLLITAVLWGWEVWSILFLSRDGRTALWWTSGSGFSPRTK